jgi:hypothetical protein
MDNLQYSLSRTYHKMMEQASEWDHYYREIQNPNLFNNIGLVPILAQQIKDSGLDNDGKVWLLQKLKNRADTIGVLMVEGNPGEVWGNRELGGPDEAPSQDPNQFGNRDYEGPTDQEQRAEEIRTATQLFGRNKGLNADWSSHAFLIKGNFPLGLWLVDDENGEWSIMNREEKPAPPGYTESGEYQDTQIFTGPFEDAVNKAQELYTK